jgi:hypothetical protein
MSTKSVVITVSVYFTTNRFRHTESAHHKTLLSDFSCIPKQGARLSSRGGSGGVVEIGGFYTPDTDYPQTIVRTTDSNVPQVYYNLQLDVDLAQPPLTQMSNQVVSARYGEEEGEGEEEGVEEEEEGGVEEEEGEGDPGLAAPPGRTPRSNVSG